MFVIWLDAVFFVFLFFFPVFFRAHIDLTEERGLCPLQTNQFHNDCLMLPHTHIESKRGCLNEHNENYMTALIVVEHWNELNGCNARNNTT